MLVFVKDFHKETKDLLSKFHTEGGKWKLESKVKGPKDMLVVNPTATNDGITAEVEFKCSKCPAGVKATVAPAGVKKVNVNYTVAGAVIEVSSDPKFQVAEVTAEGKAGLFTYVEKVSKKAVDSSLSAMVFPGIHLGANINYAFEPKALSYAFAGRFSMGGRIVDLATKNFKTFNIGAYSPLAFGKYKAIVASEIDYSKNGTKLTTAFETACPAFPKNSLRCRVNTDKTLSVSYIVALPTWKGAFSVTESGKIGAYLLLENGKK